TAFLALLEAVDRRDVVEQERQVEELDLLGVAVELRQRRSDELDIAQQQRFHLLAVAEQLRAREDLHIDLAGQEFFGDFLELDRARAHGCRLGHDVAELDHDGRLRKRWHRERQRGGTRQDPSGEFHVLFPSWSDSMVADPAAAGHPGFPGWAARPTFRQWPGWRHYKRLRPCQASDDDLSECGSGEPGEQ